MLFCVTAYDDERHLKVRIVMTDCFQSVYDDVGRYILCRYVCTYIPTYICMRIRLHIYIY